MSTLVLKVRADMENIHTLEPNGGVDDPDLKYMFHVTCAKCGEISKKMAWLMLCEDQYQGLPDTHYWKKCKDCNTVGTIQMLPGEGYPLTGSRLKRPEAFTCLMRFRFSDLYPSDIETGGGVYFDGSWKAVTTAGVTIKNINLSKDKLARVLPDGMLVKVENLDTKWEEFKPRVQEVQE